MITVLRAMALVAAALACAAILVDRSGAAPAAGRAMPRFISAPELAARIMRRDPALRVFDLRPRADYERFHVPGAAHATVRSLARDTLPSPVTAVLYAHTLPHATRASARLNERGVRDVSILRGGLYEWIARIHEPRLAADATAAERAEFEQALLWSRFFGGRPLEDVPRSQVPSGYWTGSRDGDDRSLETTLLAVAAIRRRGC